MQHRVDQTIELASWNDNGTSQPSNANYVFIHENPSAPKDTSPESPMKTPPHQIGRDNTNANGQLGLDVVAGRVKNPIRFVHSSGRNSSRNHTPSVVAVVQRRQKSKESALTLRRSIVRKLGAACGICGEQKTKASPCF